ncbi:hypothetical protein [Thomasclavelia sp.]|uniref:hypothetical protein n=1 Tax=Thomasclavelia sp. TaxID=3025757 RepID=UPI0025F6EEE5|nr:hypothetical protein [Thomasclavelia sp.]
MAFHKVHCPVCGRVMDASELAFDFGDLINIALEKTKNRHFGSSEEWYDLTGLKLCLYLTLEDLVKEYGFKQSGDNTYRGNFVFTTDDLGKHLIKIANTTRATIDILVSSVDNIEYENLTHFMAKSHDDDIDELAEKIQDIANRVKNNKGVVIASFDVIVKMQDDDQGNSFANKLEVTFDDKRTKNISKFVCRGKDGFPCGKELYGHAGRYKEIIIGLAGTARVGKTAYLAALLASIMREGDGIDTLGHDQNVLINIAYSGDGWKAFKADLLEPYVYGKKIAKTPVLRDMSSDNKEAVPLFSMTFKVNNRKNYIFTFIDMPGEVYDDAIGNESGADFVTAQREIIRSADMIWLCIAPSQIAKKHIVATADQVNINIMEAFANIEKTMQAISMTKKIPTAVLITRSDEATEEYGIFNPGFNPFASVKNPMQYLNNKTINSPWVNENGILFYSNMKWFIDKSFKYLNLTPAIPATIENIFGSFTPLAVASYGFSVDNPLADKGSGSNLPIPSMIEGPFLWTLAALGIIPVYKEEIVTKQRKKMFGLVTETYQEIENVLVTPDQIGKIFYYPSQVK